MQKKSQLCNSLFVLLLAAGVLECTHETHTEIVHTTAEYIIDTLAGAETVILYSILLDGVLKFLLLLIIKVL